MAVKYTTAIYISSYIGVFYNTYDNEDAVTIHPLDYSELTFTKIKRDNLIHYGGNQYEGGLFRMSNTKELAFFEMGDGDYVMIESDIKCLYSLKNIVWSRITSDDAHNMITNALRILYYESIKKFGSGNIEVKLLGKPYRISTSNIGPLIKSYNNVNFYMNEINDEILKIAEDVKL